MSIEEDRKLLEAVIAYRPPAELHPIAMTAWNLYEASGHQLPPEAVQQLRDILTDLKGDLTALGNAIFGVARFMIYVTESLKDAKTGDKIAGLIREFGPLYEPFWQKVGEAVTNIGEGATDAFKQFGAADAPPKTAPVFGTAAPQGSVPLRNLAPPGRPPPWAGKKK